MALITSDCCLMALITSDCLSSMRQHTRAGLLALKQRLFFHETAAHQGKAGFSDLKNSSQRQVLKDSSTPRRACSLSSSAFSSMRQQHTKGKAGLLSL